MDLTTINPDKFKDLENVFDSLDVSDSTRADYKVHLVLYLKYLQHNGFSNDSFLNFKRYLAQRGDLAVSTKNKYLVTARILLKELNRKGLLPIDVTHNVKSFRQSTKHKKDGLSEDEILALGKALSELSETSYSTRLRAMVTLLALQGLRQIEIVRLDVGDLNFANKTAMVRGKGSDDKEPISLHPETVRTLERYLKLNRISSGPLFVSNSNNSKYYRLTTRSLRRIVMREMQLLGIRKTVHGFRHFYTTKLIKNYKGDLLEVAKYTRHRSLSMLQVYNDDVKSKTDLPRYYKVFQGISF